MKRLSLFLLIVLLGSIASASHAQDGTEPILATDLLRIQQLGNVTVSPDGRHVVYTVRSIIEKSDEEGEYDYVTQLWIVSGREEPRQLTFGPEGAADPAWHPDGDRLAFVRPVDGSPQIFVMSMFGGESRQVTDAEHGATQPDWSPDGTRLLFGSMIPEPTMRSLYGSPPWRSTRRESLAAGTVEAEPDGGVEEVRAWLSDNERRNSPRVIDRLDFQGEHDLENVPAFRHFYIVMEDSTGQWSTPTSITPVWGSFASADWHPDGARVLLGGVEFGSTHPDLMRRSDIYITYIDRPRPRRLFSLEDHQVSQPKVSPDGQSVAFTARSLTDPGFVLNQAGVFPLDDPSSNRVLTADLDRSVSQVKWSPDNWHLYFVAPSDGAFPLFRVRVFDDPPVEAPTDTLAVDDVIVDVASVPRIEQLTDDESGVRAFDATTSTLYFVLTRIENPYELYSATAPFERVQRLSDHNASWLASKHISRPEHRSIRRDGIDVDYWVMRPAPFDGGRQYPMMLQIHGGPAAMWGPGEASMWHEFQYFASRGYVVVYSNPRGSGGYGYDFQRGNFQNWGTGPAGDVLAVADAAAELPFVDENRQVVTGGSYAGYLTAWIIAHDDRFRAAVAQRGVYDLPTFLGEGNAWRLVPSHFGGYPWENDPLIPPPADDPWRPTESFIATTDAAAADTLDGLLPSPADTTAADPDFSDEIELPLDTADSVAEDALSFREILARNSPLTYVAQIETPLLIIHGDQDLRTGVSQSEMLYRSLKLLGKPVEYVRYPESGHDLSRSGNPRLRLDRILRIYEFMEWWVE